MELKKRLLALGLTMALALTCLTACGGSASSSASSSAAASGSTSTAQEEGQYTGEPEPLKMCIRDRYQGVLKVLGLNDEREFQLKKHTDELSNVYEYWNELLNLSNLEENQKAFVEACRDGKMTSLFKHSELSLIHI